jgi:hypothetical protein
MLRPDIPGVANGLHRRASGAIVTDRARAVRGRRRTSITNGASSAQARTSGIGRSSRAVIARRANIVAIHSRVTRSDAIVAVKNKNDRDQSNQTLRTHKFEGTPACTELAAHRPRSNRQPRRPSSSPLSHPCSDSSCCNIVIKCEHEQLIEIV